MFDLHFHSTCSDGRKTVTEIASSIKKQKLNYCALTDHNTVDGVRELQGLLATEETVVIPGVELTAKHGDDEVHILAFDFDIDVVAKIVKERKDLVREQKVEEMQKAIALSKLEGFEISDGLLISEKQPVTLTLAIDICSKQSNQDLFLRRHGKSFIPEDLYWNYQAPEKSCAVIRSGVNIEWILNKFTDVAQDLIVAHPFVPVSVVVKELDEIRLLDLMDKGLTGIELYHNRTTDEQIGLLERLVNERSLHFTGGSDNHGRADDTIYGHYGINRPVPSFKLSRYGEN